MGILLAGLTTDGTVLSGFLLAEGLPEDWDDEEDGEWTSPTITNLEYKRPWNQKKIKNPSYQGKWKAHMIANPGFPLLLIKMPQELQDEEDPHKVKWTKVFRNLRGKDMTQDSMFEFKRKRNIPDSMVMSRLRRPSRSSRRLGMNGRRNTSLKGRSTYLADHVSCADR